MRSGSGKSIVLFLAIVTSIFVAYAADPIYIHPATVPWDDSDFNHQCQETDATYGYCTERWASPAFEGEYRYTYTVGGSYSKTVNTSYYVDFDSQKWACEAIGEGLNVPPVWDSGVSTNSCCGDDSIAVDNPDNSKLFCLGCPLGQFGDDPSKRFYNYTASTTNSCCGDDLLDCGAASGSFLCADASNGNWLWRDASRLPGSVWDVACSQPAASYLSDGENWVLCRGANSLGKKEIYSTTKLSTNTWYHITASAGSYGEMKLYIDGVEEASKEINLRSDSSQGKRFSIGNGLVNLSYFNGLIDEAAIFNYALDDSDIEDHYNDGYGTELCECPSEKNWAGDVCRNGLVAYYPFDDSVDDNKAAYHGTKYSISYETGIKGKAVRFGDSASSYITLPPSVINGRDQFTISMWIKGTGDGGLFQAVRGASTDVEDDNTWFLFSPDNLYIQVEGNNQVSGSGKNWGNNVADDKWHNLVVTFDNSKHIAKLYVDGSYSNNFTNTLDMGSINYIFLGQDADCYPTCDLTKRDEHYGGLMDELSIFNHVLSTAEITAIYNSGSVGNICNVPKCDAGEAMSICKQGLRDLIKFDNDNTFAPTFKDIATPSMSTSGTLASTPTGKIAKAGSFTASNHIASIFNVPHLLGYTMEVWIKPSSLKNATIMGWHNNYTSDQLSLTEDGYVKFTVDDSAQGISLSTRQFQTGTTPKINEISNPYNNLSHGYYCSEDTQTGKSTIVECCGGSTTTSPSCTNNQALGGTSVTSGSSFDNFGKTYFCTESYVFSEDLDGSPYTCVNAKYPNGTRTGYIWTGSKCCSEPQDGKEYYNDIIGACFNGSAVMNNGAPIGQVKAVNGQLVGCNLQDQYLLGLKDQNGQQLINNTAACTVDNGYYCDASGTWKLANGQNYSNYVTVPATWNVAEPAGCCLPNTCWNGSICAANQAPNPFSLPPKGDGYRCADGQWEYSQSKRPLKGGEFGYCPKNTQCLVSTTGSYANNNLPDKNPMCISDGQSLGDGYCSNGNWTSRTQNVVLAMIAMINQSRDYTLYCGPYYDTLNYFAYLVNGAGAKQLFDQGIINNMCVLEQGSIVMLGATYNKDFSNTSISLILPEFTGCTAAGQGIVSCNNQAFSGTWLDSQKRMLFYSKANFNIALPAGYEQSSSSLISSNFNIILSTLKQDALTSKFFAYDFTKDGMMFDRFYYSRKGARSFLATIDENVLVARYGGLPAAKVCQSISAYNAAKTTPMSISQIACIQRPGYVYVIATGSMFADINPAAIWPDLSGKIR